MAHSQFLSRPPDGEFASVDTLFRTDWTPDSFGSHRKRAGKGIPTTTGWLAMLILPMAPLRETQRQEAAPSVVGADITLQRPMEYALGGEIRLPVQCVFRLVPVSPAGTLALFAEAIAAVDRAVATGLERNRGVLAAFCADHGMHLTRALAVSPAPAPKSSAGPLVASCLTASLAALWVVSETLFSVECLIIRTKGEALPTFRATKGSVLVAHR